MMRTRGSPVHPFCIMQESKCTCQCNHSTDRCVAVFAVMIAITLSNTMSAISKDMRMLACWTYANAQDRMGSHMSQSTFQNVRSPAQQHLRNLRVGRAFVECYISAQKVVAIVHVATLYRLRSKDLANANTPGKACCLKMHCT